MVSSDLLANIDNNPIICQICNNVMSRETLFPHIRSTSMVDTAQYHLLFIEDELFQLQLMKTSLKKEYIVSMASTGQQGLELAEERRPDLILLDVNMPVMDGYEVCRRLKKNENTRNIPVIFVTSRAEAADEEQGLKSGAVDYITKPISLQILNARIAVQIRIKQLHDNYKKREESLAESLQKLTLRAEKEEEVLLQEKNNFSTILNNLQKIITIEDTERKIIWANKTAREVFNMSLSELVGKHCYKVLQNNNTACKECPLSAMDSNDVSKPIVVTGYQQDRPPFQQIHIPLFNDDGELNGIAHIVTDKI